MKSYRYIRVKAAFLTIIFTGNIIIGMGCSLGVCMCCNILSGEKVRLNTESSCHHHEPLAKPSKSKGCNHECCDNKPHTRYGEV